MATTMVSRRVDLRPIAGFKAAVLWTVVEIGIHIGALIVVAAALAVLSGQLKDAARKTVDLAFVIQQPAGVVALFILFLLFNRSRQGLKLSDLGYGFSAKILVASVISTLLLMVVLEWGTSMLDTVDETERIQLLADAGAFTAGIYFVGNGFLAPLIEEFAWRGFIQTCFRHIWGGAWALLVTAVLFVAKHIVADLSVARLSTLLVVSLVLGFVRERWGTSASTIIHLAVNLVSSLSLVTAAI